MATRTWDGGGADNLASTAGNWSDDTAPIAGDAVVFDATSSDPCTFDLTAAFLSINSTGYTGTITASVTISVSGGITFANSTFAHGNQEIIITSTQTVDVGNNELYKLTFNNVNNIVTLNSNITVNNTLDLGLTFNGKTVNGNTIFAKGNVIGTGYSISSGTTTIEFSGTGIQTWTAPANSGQIGTPIIINKSGGSLTLSGTFLIENNFTFTAGTVDAGTSTMNFGKSSTTIVITSGTMSFYNLSFRLSAVTITLADNLTITNIFDMQDSFNGITVNGNKIFAQGDVKGTGYGVNAGTTVLEFSGGNNQTWYTPANSAIIGLAIIINKSGNTLTLNNGDTFLLSGGITYTAGTVVTTNTTIKTSGTNNWNSGTLAWNNWEVASGTTTLTGNLDVNGVLTITGTLSCGSNTINCAGNFTRAGTFTEGTSTIIFDGTSTVSGTETFNNLTIASGATVHLTSTQTFTVSGAFTTLGTSTLDAVTGGSRANLPVNGSQSVVGVTATDIDSSGGSIKPISNVGGTNSNTISWNTGLVIISKLSLLGVG